MVINVCMNVPVSQVIKAVNQGALRTLAEFLSCNDIGILGILLLSLNHLLECGRYLSEGNCVLEKFEELNGVRSLESLQLHPNKKIYELVVDIFNKYIPCQVTTQSELENSSGIMQDTAKE